MASSTLPPAPTSLPGQPAWAVALLFPEQGRWSEEDYLALHTNRLVELSDGCLEVLPMPTLFHQKIVEFIFFALRVFLTDHAIPGRASFAPLPVHLGPRNYREPDIVYLGPGRNVNARGYPEGADLVMEVVSEGAESRDRDFNIKRQDYAAAGIAEYWIIDPQEQRITVLTLDGQAYREHGVFGPGSSAGSVLLPGLTVAVDQVFAAGRQGNG